MRWLIFVLLLFCNGCTKIQMLPYLDQVMVLQDFGQDKKAQEDLVKKVNAGFDRMKQAIADGKMGQYKTQNDIQKAFGPPIILEHVVEEGKIYVQALYRYAIQKNSPGKVHIYFDARGNVVKWESLP